MYATLMAYGRKGYREMLKRQIRFARLAAVLIHEHPALELLPEHLARDAAKTEKIYIVVLFRAKEPGLNTKLAERMNATSELYVSGTKWRDQSACRIAVSNWQVNPERDIKILQKVIEGVTGS